jgi:hypothetical protein
LNQLTRRRAITIGRAAVAALNERGLTVGNTVRGYERDTVDPVRNLPETSARLGLVFLAGERTPEIEQFISANFAPVVYSGGHVIVCEVVEQVEELDGHHTEQQDAVDNALVALVNELDPRGVEHDYDGELFAELREAVFETLCKLHGLTGDHARDELLMRFYPFLADEEEEEEGERAEAA